jgi:hypothetical protein
LVGELRECIVEGPDASVDFLSDARLVLILDELLTGSFGSDGFGTSGL